MCNQNATHIIMAIVESVLESFKNGLYGEWTTDIYQVIVVSFVLFRHDSN